MYRLGSDISTLPWMMATWHWADASGEPLIIQGLTPGAHRVLIELADPTHRVIDHAVVNLVIPQKH